MRGWQGKSRNALLPLTDLMLMVGIKGKICIHNIFSCEKPLTRQKSKEDLRRIH